MPLNLASPGIVVREVDLTVGRVDPTSSQIGAIVAPFAQGPIEVPTLVENENDLLNIFGRPYATDNHYESWMTASSFLAYGGPLRVVRADDTAFRNAYVGTSISTNIKIKSLDHYEELGYDENDISGVTLVARNSGTWANGIRVAVIDAFADQILTIPADVTDAIQVGHGITQAVPDGTFIAGIGTTTSLDGYFKGIVTGKALSGMATNTFAVKILTHVSSDNKETSIDYTPNGIYRFANDALTVRNAAEVSIASTTASGRMDWFDQQTIKTRTVSTGAGSTDKTIKWNSIAERPSTSSYAEARGSRFDEVHVVVIDGDGKITGNSGTILEKHLNLSKAKDAEFSVGSSSFWKNYIKSSSEYVFAGSAPAGVTTAGFGTGFTGVTDSDWGQNAEDSVSGPIIFGVAGNYNATFKNGKNYGGTVGLSTSGSLNASLGTLSAGYGLLENTEKYDVDFLLMGSGRLGKLETQALANKLIEVAGVRQDAIAFISPSRESLMNDAADGTETTIYSDSDITDNLVDFYSSVTSSSYAVFDSGYKYMYDRFNDTFRYIPLNGDIAGICARNDIDNFPWFSPAGTVRGSILNAVKLAYNPTKLQRDILYSNRVNPVVFQPGSGIVLFGDKTGLAKASAFDRINVRRLFIYLEDAIQAAARDQLFEFNDEITRTNFVNIVEPFLRDVQGKRGIIDYVVICDETNNTAAVIDNNEFVADIFIKPARSINFIGLTFVATRTGVSFEEIVGNV